MAQKVVETVLRYRVDENSVQRAGQANAAITQQLAELRQSVNQQVAPVRSSGGGISRALGSNAGQAVIREVTSQFGAVGNVIEEVTQDLPGFTGQVVALGGALSKSGGIIGTVASGAAALAAPLGTTAAAFASVAAVAAPVAVVLGGLALGIAELNRQAEMARKSVIEQVKESQARLELERSISEFVSGGNLKGAQDRLADLRRQQEEANILLTELYDRQRQVSQAYTSLGSSLNLTQRSNLGAEGQQIQAEIDRIYRDLFLPASEAADALEAAIPQIASAVGATREQIEQLQNVVRINDNFISAQIEAANLAATGTEEAVQARIDALIREQEVLVENAAIIQGQVDATAGNAEAQKAYQSQLDGVNNRIQAINNTLTVFANEGLLETARAADAAKEALDEEKRIRESSIDVVKKYNSEVERIREQAAQQEIALADRLAEQQVAIAERAADQARAALEDLERTRANLGVGLARDLASADDDARRDALDRQIDFQRDEVEATIRHQADLERIRRSAQEREFELGLSRDFAGLARSRRQTAGDLGEANQRFVEDRAQRARAFAAETEDAARQYAAEREQRLAKYQQDLIDADQAYRLEIAQSWQQTQRSLSEANAAYNRDLAQLRAKLNAELTARQQAAIGELRIIQQGQAVKLKLEEQYWLQAQKLVLAATANLGGSSSASASGSGPLLPKSMSNIRATGSGSQAASSAGSPNVNVTLNIPISTGASAEQVRGLVPAIQSVVRGELVAVFA